MSPKKSGSPKRLPRTITNTTNDYDAKRLMKKMNDEIGKNKASLICDLRKHQGHKRFLTGHSKCKKVMWQRDSILKKME